MIRIFHQYFARRLAMLWLGEAIVILTAIAWPRAWPGLGAAPHWNEFWWKAALVVALFQLSLHYNDLYNLRAFASRLDVFARLPQALGVALLGLAVLYAAEPKLRIGQGPDTKAILVLVLALAAWRALIEVAAALGRRRQGVLLLGSGPCVPVLAAGLAQRGDLGLELIGLVGEPAAGDAAPLPVRYLGGVDELGALVDRYRPRHIVLATPEPHPDLPVAALLRARTAGIEVEDAAGLYEKLSGRLPIDALPPAWLLRSDGFRPSRLMLACQRVMSTVVAGAALLLLSPLLALIALLVKLDSPGPALYKQTRCGRLGRPFEMVKFRSMRVDAERQTGPVWAGADDPRVTRLGRWLRRWRLDELPQLVNVLRGDMNLVGPRPERPAFVERLREEIPFYDLRHLIRPGLSGWAQVSAPYGASVAESKLKLEYDLFYIKNMSLLLDLFVVFQTTKIVLLGRGAR